MTQINTVNLEEIFNGYTETDCDHCYTKESIIHAIRMACEQTVDLCSENHKLWLGSEEDYSSDESILKTKKQIV